MLIQLLPLLAVSTALFPTAFAKSIHPHLHLPKRGGTIAPVMGGLNFPDPALIRVGNDFYAFATNGEVSGKIVHIQMASSSDFNTWTFAGTKDALPNLPTWVDAADPRAWAPDVVQVGNTFVMYYTAASAANTKLHCLGVATSKNVQGPYVPISQTAWACPLTQGGAIDPAGYYDPSTNTRWVVYKVDGNAIGHGGNCNNGKAPIVSTPILLQQVSVSDGYTKIGGTTELITNGPADGPVTEAPSLSRLADGSYVLFFSSNCYSGPLYDVSYAMASNIKGPYTKYGPLFVTGTNGLTAPGGLDIAVNGDHAVFHAVYGTGRAMFTALLEGAAEHDVVAYVKTT